MYTIIGLGNPGAEYDATRHNIGWQALRYLIEREKMPAPYLASSASGEMTEGVLFGQDARVLFPHTFMNRIGGAVAKVVGKDIDTSRIIAVHDDIDLPFGSIKISIGRGAGGHNGVRSMIDSLGTNAFVRVRIGIAERTFFGRLKRPTGESLSRFVLSEFKKRELAALPEINERVREAVRRIMDDGVEKAMQEVNRE